MYEQRKYAYTNSSIRLIDFGFAIEVEKWKQKEGVGVGTPDYVAPEILFSKPLTVQSDMWALGVSVFCMLTGYLPFQNDNIEKQYTAIKTCDFDFQ